MKNTKSEKQKEKNNDYSFKNHHAKNWENEQFYSKKALQKMEDKQN